METTSFVLGMLTIIGLVFLAAIVLGMVKIYSLINKVEDLEDQIENDRRNYSQDQERIHQRMEEESNHFHERIRREDMAIYDSLESQRRDILSYVDSRFDKLTMKNISKEARS